MSTSSNNGIRQTHRWLSIAFTLIKKARHNTGLSDVKNQNFIRMPAIAL
jgi:hypothetical protein